MDWNWIIGDAEFYGVEVVELLAYVFLVALVVMAIEAVVARVRGRSPVQPEAPRHATDGRTVRSH